jgi:hypothetical protein
LESTEESTTLSQGNENDPSATTILLDIETSSPIEETTSLALDESCDAIIDELCEIVDCTKPKAKELCPEHCEEACEDISPYCWMYAFDFNCKYNSFVRYRCQKCCGLCEAIASNSTSELDTGHAMGGEEESACEDISPYCTRYVHEYNCKYNNYVRFRCKESCGLCDSTNSTEIPEAEPESAQPETGDSGDEISDTTILSEISTTEESQPVRRAVGENETR